jgi:hypothetical protein
MSLILMSETSGTVILERKAKRLRVETGMLLCSTICFAISLYVAVTYAYLYVLFTTFTVVFRDQYGWHGGIVGLSFLG